MIDKLISFSIRNKMVIGLFIIALIGWGGYSFKELSLDVVPDITNNQTLVLTLAPNYAAQEVEQNITTPLEMEMASLPDLEEIRSVSRFGLSVITVVFKDNVNTNLARQLVNERIQRAKDKIPAGVGTPELGPNTTGLSEIYQYVVRAKTGYEKKYSAMDLRTIHDWIVRRQLIGTPGVAEVTAWGGDLKQYEVALYPDRMKNLNISIGEIFSALEKNNENTGGAYIDKKPNAYFIRGLGMVKSLDDLKKIVIKTINGFPVTINEVADVRYGTAIKYGAITRNGEGEIVGGMVLMYKGENSSQVIEAVKERVKTIEKSLPQGVILEGYLDRSKLVDKTISTVKTNLLEGGLIVIFILILLLGNFRAGLVVASVIPLSLLFAFGMMKLFGVSGNLMSLGAIDFGLIVDGAVIIVESIVHRLHVKYNGQNLTREQMDNEVYTSASRIRTSAAFGEIIILIVYIPIFALAGIEGKMFHPMAQTVSFAILGAFLLSLTYVPMMSALFISKKIKNKKTISDRIVATVQKVYTPFLEFTLKRKWPTVIVSLLFFILSIWIFAGLGGEFIPTLEEGDITLDTHTMPGTSLEQTNDIRTQAEKILLKKFPEVKEVISRTGAPEVPTDPMPFEISDMMVMLKDKSEWVSGSTWQEIAEKMQQELSVIPGMEMELTQPIQMRFNELMTGIRQDVAIKIYGEDLNTLYESANKVQDIIGKVEGVKDVYVEKVAGLPQIEVNYDRDKLSQYGLNISDMNKTLRIAFAGEKTGVIYEGEKRFDLVVRFYKDYRQSIEDVKHLSVSLPSGNQIPLEQIADISFKEGFGQISHEDAKRRIYVGFNVRGQDVQSVVEQIQKKLDAKLKLPPGYFISYGGQFENLQTAKKRLYITVPIALLLIFLLLYLTFRSVKETLLIYSAIPLSAIGGVFALWLRDMPFSVSAGVGFIALFGVAVLNGIVLIGEFNHLKAEGMDDIYERVRKGTKTRLRPVVMTAAVASLGFLPMAISSSAGAEVQKPLATVVIGGLISATLLTLVILPILYILFENGMKKSKISTAAISILFLLMAGGNTFAQNTSVYTLDQCVQEALKNNASVKAGMYEVDLQNKLRKTSTDIGKTNVSLTYGQYNSINRTDNNLTVSQTIPFPTVFSSNSALYGAQVKGSELKLNVTKNELVYQVKTTFNHLVYLTAYQKLLKKQDSLFTDFFSAASIRFKSGEGTLLEKSTAESRLQEVKNSLMQNQNEINIAQTGLQTLMNVANYVTISETEFQKLNLNIGLADSAAIASNPQITYLKQQVEISEKQTKVELNKALPDISFGYFSQTLIGFQTIGGQEQYFGSSNRFQGFQIGVNIPLWFVPQTARINALKLNEQVQQSNFELQQKTIEGQYKQLIQEYLKLKSALDYYELFQLPQAKLISDQSQKAYKAGEIGYFEHSQNLVQSLTIQSSYLNTVSQFNQSVININYILGGK